MDDDIIANALAFGTGYAFFREGQDVQTRELVDAIEGLREDLDDRLEPDNEPEPDEPVHVLNALESVTAPLPQEWEDIIGQGPLKRQLDVYVTEAIETKTRLPHILFASGYPGVGKTTFARFMAKALGVKIIELVPPFSIDVIVAAAMQCQDRDIVFIDEIHKLADSGQRGAEVLLKILEDGVAHLPDGTVYVLPDVTYIGATTDRDKLPDTVIDRFKLKPYFQAYGHGELGSIAVKFAYQHFAEDAVDDQMAYAIALACRGTPRLCEEMVLACRALKRRLKRPATPTEMLQFLEIEPDGLTRTHIHYLTALRQYYARETKDGGVEFIAGEAAMRDILRETTQGIGRIERFLVERGLINRSPRGRLLTARGIAKAEEFIRSGKGVSDVA